MAPRLLSSTVVEDYFPQPRTPGKHVSSAIHRIMRRHHPERFTDDPIDMARAALGNAVERAMGAALEAKYPGRYIRLSELEYDDYYGNCDLFDTEDDCVVEIKCTWASSRRVVDDGIDGQWFWRYWAQGKAYAKMLGVRKVRLIVFFIVGNWRNGKPEAYTWEDEFTDDELNETWAMIKAYASDERGQHVAKRKRPTGKVDRPTKKANRHVKSKRPRSVARGVRRPSR